MNPYDKLKMAMDGGPGSGPQGASGKAFRATVTANKVTQEARKTKDYRYVAGAHKDAAEQHRLAAQAHGKGTQAYSDHMRIAAAHESKSHGDYR